MNIFLNVIYSCDGKAWLSPDQSKIFCRILWWI